MARQGCRNHRWWPIFGLFLTSFACSFAIHIASASDSIAPAVDFKLELTWKSDPPRIWAGEVLVAGDTSLTAQPARLSQPENLTPGMLMTGGIQLSNNGDQLRFAPPVSSSHLRDRDGQFIAQQTTRGGISFRARGAASDRIVISLRLDDTKEMTAPIAIGLQDLIDGKAIDNKLNETATWTLRRSSGDRLRVSLVPESAVATSLFWDDQTARIEVACDVPIVDAVELVCDTYSYNDQSLSSQSWPLTVTAGRGTVVDAVWQPPTGDGSYELRWRLQRKVSNRSVMGLPIPNSVTDSISNPLSLIRGGSDSLTIAESQATVVVLSRRPLTPTDSLAVLGRIEPYGRSWSVSRLLPIRQATQLVTRSTPVTEPKKIVINGKLVAELDPGGSWQHSLPVAKVGERHRIVVNIPDRQAMRLGICIIDRSPQGGPPSIIRDVTCIRTRTTTHDSQWATAEVDYYPQSSSPQLVLINRDSRLPARFEAIDISTAAEAKPLIPAVSAMASQPPARTALMYLESQQWMELYGDLMSTPDSASTQRGDVLKAALRLVAAIHQEGYGGVMMTVCEDGRSLYHSTVFSADRSQELGVPLGIEGTPETLEMLLRLFDRERLVLTPCIRPHCPTTRLESAIASDPASGRGIAAATPWTGQRLELGLGELESVADGIYNPTDERVAALLIESVQELVTNCSQHACVPAIGVTADEGSCLRLPVPQATTDTTTLDRFFDSLPTDTIARSQLSAWVGNEGTEAFAKWRSERFLELVRRMIDISSNDDKALMVVSTTQPPPIELRVLMTNPRLIVARLHRRGLLEPLAARCRDEQATAMTTTSSESWKQTAFTASLSIAPNSWLEPTAGDTECLQQCGLDRTRLRTSPLLDPVSSALSLTKLLGRSDQRWVVIAGNLSTAGNEVRQRSLSRFQSLPAVLMDDVPPTDEAMKLVKLRQTVFEGATYLVATNHSRWPVAISASLVNAAAAQSLLSTDQPPTVDTDGTWRAKLEPGELLAIRMPRTDCKVRVWSAQVDGGALQVTEIRSTMRELADTIATITEPQRYDRIENGGFEQSQSSTSIDLTSTATNAPAAVVPSTVSIPGWMTAQYPVGCVELDNEVALDGERSIRLRNQGGRPGGTWIVSRAIASPTSGRIGISMMLRGEPSEDSTKTSPIVVRIAIEGSVAGGSRRESKQVEVPRDGQWGAVPFRIAVNSLPRCGVDSLRLAIDVMSEGTVWIDRVQAEDYYLTETEKSQLQSQMFLALGGISKGELSHTAKLLESHWVQQRLWSPVDPAPTTTPTQPQSLDTREARGDNGMAKPANPGIAERLKGWLPRPLRF